MWCDICVIAPALSCRAVDMVGSMEAVSVHLMFYVVHQESLQQQLQELRHQLEQQVVRVQLFKLSISAGVVVWQILDLLSFDLYN